MDHPNRRQLIRAMGLAVPALLLGRPGRAAVFPGKDIAFIIPYNTGGGFDTVVRAVAPAMERALPAKINIVPTNVPAAGGGRGLMQVVRAKPDGYTIGVFNIPGMFVAQQDGHAGYDLAGLSWLGSLGRDAYGIAVAAGSPIHSVADLRALSRQRPVTFSATGPSSTAHAATLIACELLGIRPRIVTGYKGSSDYVLGAVRGDTDAAITALPVLRRLRAGGVARVVATFEERGTIDGAADATSLGQPDLAQIVIERLVAGPPGLPAEPRAVLGAALTKALLDPEVVAWAKTVDVDLYPSSPETAAATLAAQGRFFERWKKFLSAG